MVCKSSSTINNQQFRPDIRPNACYKKGQIYRASRISDTLMFGSKYIWWPMYANLKRNNWLIRRNRHNCDWRKRRFKGLSIFIFPVPSLIYNRDLHISYLASWLKSSLQKRTFCAASSLFFQFMSAEFCATPENWPIVADTSCSWSRWIITFNTLS